MILEGIVALIVQAGSGLAAITANRIYPGTLPENIGAALATGGPAIVFKVIGGSSEATLDSDGMQKQRVQFDCYAVGTATASGYKAANDVREALRELLNGYNDTLPDGSFLDNADLIEARDAYMNDARQYVAEIEFRLLYTFTP
jgi:hypothetical protein